MVTLPLCSIFKLQTFENKIKAFSLTCLSLEAVMTLWKLDMGTSWQNISLIITCDLKQVSSNY